VGPHMGNFSDHVAALRTAGGLVEVANASALVRFVSEMLDNPAQRCWLAEHAAATVQLHADLPARTAEAMLSLLPGQSPGTSI
jgi:3-deoxy-D-manno-octulosonic-acid transferase